MLLQFQTRAHVPRNDWNEQFIITCKNETRQSFDSIFLIQYFGVIFENSFEISETGMCQALVSYSKKSLNKYQS